MKKLIVLCLLLFSCEPPHMHIKPLIKVGCECNDGTRVIWDENVMKQTGFLTGNPCWDKGGIKGYIYQ